MKKPVRIQGESGFSLIELMIVVAIIGILATIAVPNFQRMQAKAKQSEAKMQLGALHTSMKAFHAEWNQYRGDFRDIGYMPEGRLVYHVGFAGPGPALPPPFNPSTTNGGAGACVNTGVAGCGWTFSLTPNMPAFRSVAARGSCGPGVVPNQTQFTASAIGNLAGGQGTNATDEWTMTQDKVLCNNLQGF